MLLVQSDSIEFLFKRKIFLRNIQKESLQVIQGIVLKLKIIEIFQDK